MSGFMPGQGGGNASGGEGVAIDGTTWFKRVATGESAAICREMIAMLDVLGASRVAGFDAEEQVKVNLFVYLMLSVMAHPNFGIPDDKAAEFINRNHLISNLVAQSSFKTTDAFLEVIRDQPRNFIKILTLWSARNRVTFDVKAIHKLNGLFGSMWFMQFAELFHAGLVEPAVQAAMEKVYGNAPGELAPVCNLQEPYFGASYLYSTVERGVKAAINRGVQQVPGAMREVPAGPRDPRKIAVASCHWRPNHSVYRIVSAFIEALRPKYHVTFLQLGRHSEQQVEGFDEVKIVESDRGLPKLDAVVKNDYSAIIYPDIGMSSESIILSNLRLAPVQMAMLGHSVSTFGADVDYFISGAGVEVKERPEQHYSERLVLLPGMGCVHNVPLVKPMGRAKVKGKVVVSCPWQGHKVNVQSLAFLKKVLEAVGRKPGEVVFRFFVGGATKLYNDHPPFARAVGEALPAGSYQIYTDLSYEDYMGAIEECHLALDSWHFGGCNTVSDSLWLRVPIVCREGERWYNRIGPYMLRAAGLGELVARTEEEQLALAVKLIGDEAWREDVTRKVKGAELMGTVYTKSDAGAFAGVFDYLMGNHAALKAGGDRAPIRWPLQ